MSSQGMLLGRTMAVLPRQLFLRDLCGFASLVGSALFALVVWHWLYVRKAQVVRCRVCQEGTDCIAGKPQIVKHFMFGKDRLRGGLSVEKTTDCAVECMLGKHKLCHPLYVREAHIAC